MEKKHETTELLIRIRNGDDEGINILFPFVYQKLKHIAKGQLHKLNPGETIKTKDLVHEAYLKLIDQSQAEYKDGLHFYAVAARAMRQILLNHLRSKLADKRGGKLKRVDLDEDLVASDEQASFYLDLNEALIKLNAVDERQHQIVELRFFAGMKMSEIGELLGISERHVGREWVKAKAFLSDEFRDEDEESKS